MPRIEVRPMGFPTTVEEASPGLLIWFGDDGKPHVAFKSEYSTEGRCDAYNEGGEYLCDRSMPVYPCEITLMEGDE